MAESLKEQAKTAILDVYHDSRDFYRANKNEFEELWKLAHSEPLKTKKKFNRFIPYIASAIDLVLPRLAGKQPNFEVSGMAEDDEKNANIIEKLVKWYLDKLNFHDFEVKYIKESIIYGTAIAQVGWEFKQSKLHPDLVMKMGQSMQVTMDDPTIEVIPLENVFPHRKKVSIQDEWPLVIREEVSLRDLKEDPNIDQKEVKKIQGPMDESEYFTQLNKSSSNQDASVNQSDTKNNGVYVKLTYWGPFDYDGDGMDEECVCTLVNFDHIVRLEQNPFYHQRKPFVKLDYNPDPHRFFNDGLVKQLSPLQLELNEIRNVRSKARALSLNKVFQVDRGANVNLDTLKFEPGAVVLYDATQNPEPIKEIEVSGKLLELEREEESVKRDMQTRSGINDVVTGTTEVGIAGGDTATGASIAAEQTSMRFKTQAVMIDVSLREIGQQLVSNIQQFVDQPKVIRVLGEEHGMEWVPITPDEIQGKFDFRVMPMSTLVEPKAAKRERLLSLKQLYMEDPTIDHERLDRMIFESFDLDPDQVMKSPEEQMKDQAAMELEEVAKVINSPEFDGLPIEQQEELMQQNERLLQETQGGEEQVMAAPAPEDVTQGY